MNNHQCLQTLHLRLLDMARVCQQGVDYSIKAYSLGSIECCSIVQSKTLEINIRHLEIAETAREILLMEIGDALNMRFALSAERICNALQEIHAHANDIATNTMGLLGNSRRTAYKELVSMGDVVNRFMRLCVVALFEEGIEHAEIVIRGNGVEREFEARFFDRLSATDRRETREAVHDIAVAESLSQIARELHEVASAIVFWLNDADGNWTPDDTRPWTEVTALRR